MPTEGLDSRPYYQILHAALRHDGSDAETERSERVLQWLTRARNKLDRVIDKSEMRLIGLVWRTWSNHKQAPTRATLNQAVVATSQHKDLLNMLEEYDRHAEDLMDATWADMDLILDRRVADYEKFRFDRFLTQALVMLNGSVPNPNPLTKAKKPELSGTGDTLNYLMDKISKGILINDARMQGGLLAEHTGDVQKIYDQKEAERLAGRLTIPTGINVIDMVGGLKRKEMSAILGYVGQRKSATIRTMAYYAAASNFRVLHIPLESSFEEELIAYNVMHAHAVNWGADSLGSNMSRRDFEAGNMTPDQYDFMMSRSISHFEQTVARYLTVIEPGGTRSWADIRSIIERECYIAPVDLVIIDYLTMCNPNPENRDKTGAMIEMIRDAKQLTLTANDGMGLCLVTPVQGSRKGLEDAQENDGAWEITGISTYSEMDKSLDNCYYVYTTDELSTENKLKIGSCKMRRGVNIPPSFVAVNPAAGMLTKHESDAGTDIQMAALNGPADAPVGGDYMPGFFD